MPVNSIGEQFSRVLGRAPSQDEMDYFKKFLDAGELQGHEIGQILQSTPEFQESQLNKNVAAYDTRLQAADAEALQRGVDVAGAQATSRFAGLSRPNSSALAASVFGKAGQLAGDMASRRASALADFYGQGLQGNAARTADIGAGLQGRAYGLRDETRQRGYQLEDYYRMKNDAADYERGHGGWNAITPEFVGQGLFSVAGKAAAAYTGGMAGRSGGVA